MSHPGHDHRQCQDPDGEAETVSYLRNLEVMFKQSIHREPNVATALRSLRVEQQMSITEASGRAGISKSYLCHIEHGRHVPLRTLALIGSCSYSLTARMVRELLIFAIECDERDRAIRMMKTRSEKQEEQEKKEGDSDAQV